MTDLHARTLRALGIRLILDRVKAVDEENRQAIRGLMAVGDRKTASLPLQLVDDNLVVGAVTYAKGSPTARVTDPGALLKWVRDNRPTEIVESVRGSYLAALLSTAKKYGEAVDERTGEVIPGIEVHTGDPVLKVVPEKTAEAESALVAALSADSGAGFRALLTDGQT